MTDVLIVGGGPAGLTAALYALRAGKSALVLEKNAFGGQITASPRVENYPGLAGVSGLAFADALVGQVLALGGALEPAEACALELAGTRRAVRTADGGVYEGRALVLATGAKPRTLGLPREAGLTGLGVSYCAVCDGAFYRGRTVAVAGGGDTALQDALFLSDLCEKVFLIHRRDAFRGEARLAQALAKRPNVEIVWNSRVTALHGEGALAGLTVTDTAGRARQLAAEGLFVAIGQEPETQLFAGAARLDAAGCADAGEDCAGALPGVFVAGDCRRKPVRQLTTAVSDGTVAALAAAAWLDGQ